MAHKWFKKLVYLLIAVCLAAGGLLPAISVKAYNCGTGDGDCMVIEGPGPVLSDVIQLMSGAFSPIALSADPFNLIPVEAAAAQTDMLNNSIDLAVSDSACISGVDDQGTASHCSDLIDVVFAHKNGQDWHLLAGPGYGKPLNQFFMGWILGPSGQAYVKSAGYTAVAPTAPNGGSSAAAGKVVA